MCGESCLASLVWSLRRATVAQITEQFSAGYDRKVWELNLSLLCMWLCSCSQSACDDLCTLNTYSEHRSITTGPWSNRRRWLGLMNHFFYITWNEMAPRSTIGRREAVAVWCSGQCPGINVGVILTHTQYTTLWQQYSLIVVSTLSRIMFPAIQGKHSI